MKSKRKKLKAILPFVREYQKGIGVNNDQPNIILDVSKREGGNIWLGNAVVARITKTGILHHQRSSTYCTGAFFREYHPNSKDPIIIQIQDCFPDLPYEAYREWINWVVNGSPWADAFITKNINTILTRRVVLIDGDLPFWYKKEATIAIRMAWENYYNNFKYRETGVWWELAQKIDPNLSYIVSRLITAINKNTDKIVFRSEENGHSPINYSMSSPNYHLLGWMKNKRLSGGWESTNPLPLSDIKAAINQVGKTTAVVNPFGNSTSASFKRDEFVEKMHELLPPIAENIYGRA